MGICDSVSAAFATFRRQFYFWAFAPLALVALVLLFGWLRASTPPLDAEGVLAVSWIDYWFHRYQALIAGILGLAGGLAAFFGIRSQISQADRHNRERQMARYQERLEAWNSVDGVLASDARIAKKRAQRFAETLSAADSVPDDLEELVDATISVLDRKIPKGAIEFFAMGRNYKERANEASPSVRTEYLKLVEQTIEHDKIVIDNNLQEFVYILPRYENDIVVVSGDICMNLFNCVTYITICADSCIYEANKAKPKPPVDL